MLVKCYYVILPKNIIRTYHAFHRYTLFRPAASTVDTAMSPHPSGRTQNHGSSGCFRLRRKRCITCRPSGVILPTLQLSSGPSPARACSDRFAAIAGGKAASTRDRAFLWKSARRWPESKIIGAGKRGPISEELQKTFFDIVEGKKEDKFGWLDYV